jgi:hypothetical protein
MTQKRRDTHSTEFGLWLREQKEIDSCLGFVTTNLDYIWTNYKTGEWMLIEEKRYNSEVKPYQRGIFKTIHAACKNAHGYKGIHLLQFEKTSPDDGRIWIDKKEVDKKGLLQFLRFEKAEVVNGKLAKPHYRTR